MNRKEAAELSPFIKAFGEGKDIEMRSKNPHAKLNGWAKMDEFIFGNFEYRIKPEPKYRPFKDAEECWQEMQKHQPFIKYKVIESSKDVYLIIQRIKTDGIETDVERLDFETAFEWFTFADGTPFGVKEDK